MSEPNPSEPAKDNQKSKKHNQQKNNRNCSVKNLKNIYEIGATVSGIFLLGSQIANYKVSNQFKECKHNFWINDFEKEYEQLQYPYNNCVLFKQKFPGTVLFDFLSLGILPIFRGKQHKLNSLSICGLNEEYSKDLYSLCLKNSKQDGTNIEDIHNFIDKRHYRISKIIQTDDTLYDYLYVGIEKKNI